MSLSLTVSSLNKSVELVLLPSNSTLAYLIVLLFFILFHCKTHNYFVLTLLTIRHLRYHGRWIDSVWKSRSYAGALKENPVNLYIF